MQQRFSKVQCKDKTEVQHFTCIPIAIVRHLGIGKSLYLKWTPNDDGTVTITKLHNKPTTKKPMTVDEWLVIITPHIPTDPPGKSPFEIYKEAGITKKSISPIYVDRARRDINLQSHEDPRTHKTLWYRLYDNSSKPQKIAELKQIQLPRA